MSIYSTIRSNLPLAGLLASVLIAGIHVAVAPLVSLGWTLPLVLALVGIALLLRGRAPGRVAGAAMMIALLVGLCAAGVLWQLSMLLALLGWAWLGRVDPALRQDPRRAAPRGRLVWAPTLFVGGITPFALVAWFVLFQPDLGDITRQIPDLPLPLLVAGGVGFSLLNATLEEFVWRAVLYDGLAAASTKAWVPILGTAVSMGLWHAWGFPRGVVGVLMVSLWAIPLGMLRHHSRGLLSPIAAHVIADATIAVVLLSAR